MELQPCGTVAAYRRHRRKRATPCEPCFVAWRTYMNRYYRERRAAHPGGRRLIPADGARRRLRALQAIGWTERQLATELGISQASLSLIVTSRRFILPRTGEQVVNLFDRLQTTPGTLLVPRHWEAQRKELPPPLAWDEETIDDPAAQPAEWRRPARAQNRSEDIARDAAELMGSFGESPEGAAARLGITVGSMQTAIRRYNQRVSENAEQATQAAR